MATLEKVEDLAQNEKKFDLVVFGASGFTGQYVIKDLVKHKEQRTVTWAVAGRSKSKLSQCLHEVELETGKKLKCKQSKWYESDGTW